MKDSLSRFKQIEKELTILHGFMALMSWDRATLMPKNAIHQRADQMAYLSLLAHQRKTSKEILRCVDILTKPAHLKQLSKIERLSVLKFKKEITKERKLPAEHIEKFSKLIPESEAAWEKAKAKSNFSIFRPYLEKCVQLSKQSAAYIDP
ncbi:MAG: hypothetical protein QF915_01255, partial [Candidatus Woesearchaeota archaeon]|nr:hypothetical protein [Candidatus Woesearchaeota archaeon]